MSQAQVYRIEVAPQTQARDPQGDTIAARIRAFMEIPVETIRVHQIYKIAFVDPPTVRYPATDHLQGKSHPLSVRDLRTNEAFAERIRTALTDPVTQYSTTGKLDLPHCDWVIRVGFRPGVTDNVARTAQVFIRELLADESTIQPEVSTEKLYAIGGSQLSAEALRRIVDELLVNPLLEYHEIHTASAYRAAAVDLSFDHLRTDPAEGQASSPTVEQIVLPDDDDGLLALNRQRSLALNLREMRAIRAYYQQETTRASRAALGLPQHPVDLELECIAQTWSEHCKHKIFAAKIDYTDESGESRSINSLFKTFIVEATQQIAERVDWLVSVFHDNAGVVRICEDTNLVFKVETHNSPSALDPYGGAMTGIVGVNRDPFGTGMGASLLTNTWGYCLASPFHKGDLPQGLLHPQRIRDGVHAGVIDGGNQSGIPYSRGFEVFDHRYLGKPLVFCGTVGVMPTLVGRRPSERKEVAPGDLIVMVGGRIGKDGLHGATFSSEALHSNAPTQAVQIGDPITQKMMTDMLLEARDMGLYRAITDNGAGGLSSSIGEMARLCGGAIVDLDRAPLKYAGLSPWEIFLSEAQERMTLAVDPSTFQELSDLAARREVEVSMIGRFTDQRHLQLRHKGDIIADLEMGFLHEGCPQMILEARWDPPAPPTPADLHIEIDRENSEAILLEMVADLNYCSKEKKCRSYDHEVKGLSVVKPLIGRYRDIPADATVMRVTQHSDRAVILSEAILPHLSDLDPGVMAGNVVDLALRRTVATGGRLGQIAALDNFCWPDPVLSAETPDGRQKLAGLVRCCETLFKMTTAFDMPLISGKDSMKNDSTRGGVKISIPPTLLVSTMAWVNDLSRIKDLRIRRETGQETQHAIYLLGTTRRELGASLLYEKVGLRHRQLTPSAPDGEGGGGPLIGRSPPWVRPSETIAVCRALEKIISRDLISAAHAPHRGGLALALVTMSLASDIGFEIDLESLPGAAMLSPIEALFSESPSRFLVATPLKQRFSLEARLAQADIPWIQLGESTPDKRLIVRDAMQKRLVDLSLETLRTSYKETLNGI